MLHTYGQMTQDEWWRNAQGDPPPIQVEDVIGVLGIRGETEAVVQAHRVTKQPCVLATHQSGWHPDNGGMGFYGWRLVAQAQCRYGLRVFLPAATVGQRVRSVRIDEVKSHSCVGSVVD